MCGRMVVVIDGRAYFHQLNTQDNTWEYVPAPAKYNHIDETVRKHGKPQVVAPTEQAFIHRVVGKEIVPELAYWTLVPPWIEGGAHLVTTKAGETRLSPPPRTHFNSRRDTLLRSKGWATLLRRNRCVIFLDSFFEWSDEKLLAGRPKLVGRYRLTGERLMPVAGIWSTASTPDGRVQTFSAVTCDPNEMLTALPHHRMPAILLGDSLRAWLDPRTEHPEELLHQTGEKEMEAYVRPAKLFSDLLK